MTEQPAPDDLADAIRGAVQYDNPAVRAAAELVIWKRLHLRGDFAEACISRPGSGVAAIDWMAAWHFAETAPRMSSSESRVLRFAADLARDEESLWYQLAGLGHAHRFEIVRAAGRALRVSVGDLADDSA